MPKISAPWDLHPLAFANCIRCHIKHPPKCADTHTSIRQEAPIPPHFSLLIFLFFSPVILGSYFYISKQLILWLPCRINRCGMTDTLHLVAADKVILGGEGSISNKLKRQQPNLFARENKPCSQHCYFTGTTGHRQHFHGRGRRVFTLLFFPWE